MRWEGCEDDDVASELVNTGLRRYGFRPGEDVEVLRRLGGYGLLVHGHDREEDGAAPTGSHALLLCSSFGAKRARKAYLVLDPARRYQGVESIREGVELRRLWR